MDFFKTNVRVFETGTTMELAKTISNFVRLPLLVVADIQTSARGQFGRKWDSQIGGLWFTEAFQVNSPLGLSTFMSIPILRSIKRIGDDLPVKIKWPNDILLSGKKVAGILIEIVDKIAFVGIGINVENNVHIELLSIATNLKSHVNITKEHFLEIFLEEQNKVLPVFLEKGFSAFKEEYDKYLIFINSKVKVKVENEIIEGEAIGVGDSGELKILTNQRILDITYGTVISYK